MSEGIDSRWKLFDTSPSIVEQRFSEAQGFASGAYTTALAILQSMQNIANGLQIIGDSLAPVETVIPGITLEEDIPEIDMSLLTVKTPTDPQEPAVIDTTFDTFPEFPDLVVGEVPIPDETYVSSLFTALKAKFLSDINSGGTGISAAVEDAIFNREYERALSIHNDAMDEVSASVARGGYPIPNGALLAMQNKELADYRNKRLDLSRDVAIKSFELAFQHTQFVMQYGITFELGIMNWAHSVAALASEAAKTAVQMQIEAFKAKTSGIHDKIIGIIEKAKAQVDYNRGLIEIYKGRIEAFSSKMRSESDRINAVARGYESQVGLFRSVADFDIAKAGLDLKVLEARINQYMAEAGLFIKDKEIEMKNYEVINSLRIEVMKAAGQIAAQLAAGAMAGVQASAHVEARDAANYNANLNYDMTKD